MEGRRCGLVTSGSNAKITSGSEGEGHGGRSMGCIRNGDRNSGFDSDNLAWRLSQEKEEDDPYDAIAMKLLEDQLKLKKWTDIKTLENITGLNTEFTRQYLILLKARGSRKDGKKWGLVSKNPLSEEDTE